MGGKEDAAADALAGKKAKLEIVKFGNMLEIDTTARYLVKGVIDEQAIVLLYGPTSCGKTFLTLDLALHVAAGMAWFGHRVTKAPVVYAAIEAGPSLKKRVAAWAEERCEDEAGVSFRAVLSPVRLCNLGQGDDVDALIEIIGEAKLVVIDTVSAALAGGEENASADMGRFVAALQRIRARLGCAIIAVHHIGKDASRGGRGHSNLPAAVDAEIEVERRKGAEDEDTGISVAKVTKQRDGTFGEEIAFILRQVELGQDQDGDPITSCVVERADYVPEKKSKAPSRQLKDALLELNLAVHQRGELRPNGEIEHYAVRLEIWREYMVKSGRFGDDGSARFKMAWSRVQRYLPRKNHAVIEDGYAWPTRPEAPM